MALAMATILGLNGSIIGYTLREPEYTSTAVLRVKPNLPKVLYENEQNQIMPMFDAYMQTQVSLLESQRVIDFAMQNTEWLALGRSASDVQIARFQQSLSVVNPGRSQLIEISFTDLDPHAAVVAVDAVTSAYLDLHGDGASDRVEDRLAILEQRRDKLQADLRAVGDQKLVLASEFGSDSLERQYERALDDLDRVQEQLMLAQISLAAAGFELDRQEGDELLGGAVASVDASEIGSAGQLPTAFHLPPREMESLSTLTLDNVESMLTTAMAQKLTAERELHLLTARMGNEHPAVSAKQRLIRAYDDEIEILQLLSQRKAKESTGNGESTIDPEIMHLAARARAMRSVFDEASQRVTSLGRVQLQIGALQAEEVDLQARLDEVQARIEEMRLESSVGGRIEIASYAARPVAPSKDKRSQLALIGAVGGVGLGFAGVMLVSFLRGELRYVADADYDADTNAPSVLGVIPEISDKAQADRESIHAASNAIHQIRHRLMHSVSGVTTDGPLTIALTSPAAGVGKTHVVIALSLSFAASAKRVLLIDADVIGAGLTTAFDPHFGLRPVQHGKYRPLRDIVQAMGMLSHEQLSEFDPDRKMNDTAFARKAIADELLEMSDIEQAVMIQRVPNGGLLSALQGEPLEHCVAATEVANLDILTKGPARRQHVAQLSTSAVSDLVSRAGAYDVILIDTGPILGSFEALTVARAAHTTAMVVARGAQRRVLHKAVKHSEVVGANLTGLIFNRALPQDFTSSPYGSRYKSNVVAGSTSISRTGPNRTQFQRSLARLGPLASIVASEIQLQENAKSLGRITPLQPTVARAVNVA